MGMLVVIPILLVVSVLGVLIYCWLTDKVRKERYGKHYNHPDKDMPLYDRGPCDYYSVGTFYW